MTLFYILLETLPEEERDFVANLYETYKYKIKKMALKRVKQEADADDVLQIVAVNIIKNVDKFKGKDKKDIESQLVIYTRNAAINYCQKLYRHAYYENQISVMDDEEKEIDIPDDGPGVEELIVNEETADRTRRAVKKLRKSQQDVINLYYGLDYSYEEIADLLEISVSAVGTKLHRAKERLEQLLKAENILMK